jgi:hypothetical protein
VKTNERGMWCGGGGSGGVFDIDISVIDVNGTKRAKLRHEDKVGHKVCFRATLVF